MGTNKDSGNNNASDAAPQKCSDANATEHTTGGNADINIVRQFLREVRILSETVNDASWAEL